MTFRRIERLSPSDWRVEAASDYRVPLAVGAETARSLSSTVVLNCPSRNVRVEAIRYFREYGAVGEFARRDGSYQWGRPPAGSVEAVIESTICGKPSAPADSKSVVFSLLDSAEGSSGSRSVAPVTPMAKGAYEIQLFSASTRDIADAVAHQLTRRWSGAGHTEVTVRRVVVHGVTFYRVMAGPFAGATEAQSACKSAAAITRDCFLRSRDVAG